jgi:hypothetical protein
MLGRLRLILALAHRRSSAIQIGAQVVPLRMLSLVPIDWAEPILFDNPFMTVSFDGASAPGRPDLAVAG